LPGHQRRSWGDTKTSGIVKPDNLVSKRKSLNDSSPPRSAQKPPRVQDGAAPGDKLIVVPGKPPRLPSVQKGSNHSRTTTSPDAKKTLDEPPLLQTDSVHCDEEDDGRGDEQGGGGTVCSQEPGQPLENSNIGASNPLATNNTHQSSNQSPIHEDLVASASQHNRSGPTDTSTVLSDGSFPLAVMSRDVAPSFEGRNRSSLASTVVVSHPNHHVLEAPMYSFSVDQQGGIEQAAQTHSNKNLQQDEKTREEEQNDYGIGLITERLDEHISQGASPNLRDDESQEASHTSRDKLLAP